MSAYKDLLVWQKSFLICREIYNLTQDFPGSELFGLTDQIRRSAVSVMSNIAEGSRRSRKEWRHFIRISFASAAELESQLLLAKDLGFGNLDKYGRIFEELNDVSRILYHFLFKTVR
jgi:four helix bundle protein